MKKLVAMIMMVMVVVSMTGAQAEASCVDITAVASSANAVRAFQVFERSINANMTDSHIISMGSGSVAINLSGMNGNDSGNNLYNLFSEDIH